MTDGADFVAMMEPVARLLFGDPNKALSSGKKLRFGNRGSLAVDTEKGVWHRHGEDVGGGVLDLVKAERGLEGRAAIAWLREQGFTVPDRDGPRANGAAKGGDSGRMSIAATYDYLDEAGTLLFQVCRMEPKDFRQRRRARPDDPPERVKNGWVWSIKDCRQVPYRLPDLIEAVKAGMTVFVVEGEKDVENLKKMGVPATCNAAGAGKWPPGLEQFFQDADVVLLPDNDPQATSKEGDPRFHPDGRPIFVGQDHMEMVGSRLGNVVRNLRVIELPKLPVKGDVSDWIEAGGTADALYDLAETAEDFADWVMRRPAPGVTDPNAPFQSKFHAIRWRDLDSPAEEHEWLIKDVLTRREVAIMAGPSQSGKTFLAGDVGMAVARGVPWFDKRVSKGGVIYQAGEGRRGLLKRLRAYRIENDVSLDDPVPFVLLPSPIDLYASDDHTNALIVEIKHWAATFDVPLELVVIDTLAAATSGADENSGKDMGPVLARCSRISIECKCSVLLVHHMNAGGQKARGWTGITANVDSVIAVAKLETDKGQPVIDVDKRLIREWHLTKQKDGEDGLRRRFVLPSVETGRDKYNEPITSCVVRMPNDEGEPGETQRPTDTGIRLTPQQDLFLRAIYQARDEHGEEAPAALGLPRGVRVVRWSFVTQIFAAIGFEAEQETDPKKKADKVAQAAKRAGERLMQLRIIMREKPYVWLTEKKVRGFGRADRREAPREPNDRPPPPDEDPYEGGLL